MGTGSMKSKKLNYLEEQARLARIEKNLEYLAELQAEWRLERADGDTY